MSSPKIKPSCAIDPGNDSLDTYITQAIAKDPLLSFSKPNDPPVQLFQLLHSLDQGWPLLSPLKIQLHKCDKCSREFCSTINYRRHLRLHRRNLSLNKDSTVKNRSLLQAFWDKLSVGEAMEIMSFKDVSLEGVPGSSIVKALGSCIRKPGFPALPQHYVKAGYALLDIVQAKASRFPISSQDLFNVFDEASENTFLCAGAAESLHKYVFDGEAGKVGLEMRNVIACTSFLAEQKLVRACLAHKDAEALRYQKLLMEEEEAAQNRQAALLEKKRQKKLRQKEQRAKGLEGEEADDSPEDSSPSPPTSSPADAYDSNPETPETTDKPTSSSQPTQVANDEIDMYEDHAYGCCDLGTYQHLEYRTVHQNGRKYKTKSRWQAPKFRKIPNGFHAHHNYQSGPIQKGVNYRDFRSATTNNCGKVWTPKPKSQVEEESLTTRLQIEVNLPRQDKKHEFLIGSISVALGCCSNPQHGGNLGGGPDTSSLAACEPSEKHCEGNFVSQGENGDHLPPENCCPASKVGDIDGVEQVSKAKSKRNGCEETVNSSSVQGEHQGVVRFSSGDAEAFLAKRWKEAMASNHLKLVLLPDPESEPPGHPPLSTKFGSIGKTNVESMPLVVKANVSMRPKPDKGSKLKYIPKQRATSSN